MRRWLRVLVVGVLTVILSIDSASACRLFRSRCRPRCRVVTCHPCTTAVSVETLPVQCCVPVDGSAHAVIVETAPTVVVAPGDEASGPVLGPPAPAVADVPQPAAPQPVSGPLEPLTPIAPASAEQPLSAPAPAAAVPQPQFKTAAEILAESAEKERLEKAAAEAAKPAAPEPPAPIEPAPEQPAPEPEAPPAKPAPKQPAPKPAEENFFDEDGDAAEEAPPRENRAPMKKKEAPQEPVEDLFNEPEADTPPADSETEPTEKPAEEAPSEESTEKTEDDPFAALEADPEPVRRWIDSTGRHETIGRLVEVHPDRVRILKANGRYTTVPMQQLSQHDRAYAATVGERLATQAPGRPAVTDTAHR